MDEQIEKIAEGVTKIVALVKVFYDASIAAGFTEDQAMALALEMSERMLDKLTGDKK